MNDVMKDLEGLGSTKQRRVVFRVIHASHEHLTANEVFADARRLLPGISFATVYNSLRYLKNEGLIGEVRFGTNITRYDRNLERHDHALCTKCGTLVDFEMKLPGKLVAKAAKESNFKPESLEFTLRGLCPECSK